jgi:hypothetical protein
MHLSQQLHHMIQVAVDVAHGNDALAGFCVDFLYGCLHIILSGTVRESFLFFVTFPASLG